LSWITFSKQLSNDNEYPRVLTYINVQITYLHLSFHRDIFDYKDIKCFSFFDSSFIYFIINVYSDNQQLALKYLKNTEVNINNVLIMTSNFNIRDRDWDSSYLHYLAPSDILTDVANSFELVLSFYIHQVLMRYIDNSNNSNSVIDLIFLQPDLVEVDNYLILSELWYSSDHAPLTVDISINEEFI